MNVAAAGFMVPNVNMNLASCGFKDDCDGGNSLLTVFVVSMGTVMNNWSGIQ